MDIKKIQMALMAKASNEMTEDDKLDFIGKFNSTLDVETILEKGIGNVTEDNYEEFVGEILLQIFDNLLTLAKNEEAEIDTVGLWLHYDDKVVDNSITLSILNDIEKYGADDINPIYEFYKMTLNKYEEA